MTRLVGQNSRFFEVLPVDVTDVITLLCRVILAVGLADLFHSIAAAVERKFQPYWINF